MTRSLTIIGAGRLGQTLGHLWQQQGHFRIAQVMCLSESRADKAIDFIGTGSAAWDYRQLTPADAWLIATPDQEIASAAKALADRAIVKPGNLVFHCSGALASSELIPLRTQGADTASVHPVHNFANPETAIRSFAGSFCAFEGDDTAIEKLLPAFEALQAKLIPIDGNSKTLYHTGSVIACNYLVTLLDAGLQCLKKAGLDDSQASALLAPLVKTTVDNVLQGSAEKTLTGPIARGDAAIVANQQQAMEKHLPQLAQLYRVMGLNTVEIARRQQQLPDEKLNQLDETLKQD